MLHRIPKIGVIFLAVLAMAGECPVWGDGRVHEQIAKETVVARVEGRPISLAILMRRMSALRLREFGNSKMTKELGDQLRQKALQKLILEEAMLARAANAGYQVTDEQIDQCVARKRGGFRDEKHYRKYLEILNMNESDVRLNCKRYGLMQQVVDQEVNRQVGEPDRATLREIYDKNRQRFISPEQVEVTDVIFFLDPADKASMAKARSVRQEFIDTFDGDPLQAPEDEMYYCRPQVRLDKEKRPVAWRLSRVLAPYGLSDIFEEDGTLHLVRLTGHRPRVERSFEQALPELKKMLQERERKQALQHFLADLKASAQVELIEAAASGGAGAK